MGCRGPGLRCRGGGLPKRLGHGTETVFYGAGPGAMWVNILSISAKELGPVDPGGIHDPFPQSVHHANEMGSPPTTSLTIS